MEQLWLPQGTTLNKRTAEKERSLQEQAIQLTVICKAKEEFQ